MNGTVNAFIAKAHLSIPRIENAHQQMHAYDSFLRFDSRSQLPDPLTSFYPEIHAVLKTDPDTLRYHEAMKSEDAEEFIEGMKKEIICLERLKTWCLRKRSTIGQGTIPETWAFWRKQ